jgi:hypothetical protein
MMVMNFVWPITALYFGPFALWKYFAFGRQKQASGPDEHKGHQHEPEEPFWQKVWIGDTHCGAGCTLDDIIAEWIVFLTGFTLLGSTLWASYLLDLYSPICWGSFSIFLHCAHAEYLRLARYKSCSQGRYDFPHRL